MMGKGSQHVLRKHIITRDSTVKLNVVLTWDEKYEESVVLAVMLNDLCKANKVYGQRFGIEPMHKDWKTNAFDLEKTRVTDPKRRDILLIPLLLHMFYV
jgi:hypothetical protein